MVRTEEAIKKWFTRIVDGLEAYGPPQTAVDRVIMPSVSVVENYLMSACLLAGLGRSLPAKALLRPVGEFTATVKYCLVGGGSETIERIQRWQKSSWKKYKEYLEGIRTACQGHDCTHIDARIEEVEKELGQMDKFKELPKFKQILESGFSQDHAIRMGIYAQHLAATHIDILTLAQTVTEEAGTTEFAGDLVEGSLEMEADLLSQAYLYVETVSKHYGWDYAETLSEYKVLTHSNDGKVTN
ncbi:MAG: hypothetical protein NTZ17_08165 [Phycisphaerae bacterium]|nr:hypothetical protein [Phycisphaerae bacterium]